MKIELTRTHKEFSAFRHVSKALAKNTARYALLYIKVNLDCIVGIDGMRLHVVYGDFTGFECGSYEVLKNNQKLFLAMKVDDTQAGNFPKWQCVIPERFEYRIEHPDTSKLTDCQFFGFVFANNGILINQDFLKDALENLNNPFVEFISPERPVMVTAKDKHFAYHSLIMPTTPPRYTTIELNQKEVA